MEMKSIELQGAEWKDNLKIKVTTAFFLFLSSVNAPGTSAHVSHWSYGTSTSS